MAITRRKGSHHRLRPQIHNRFHPRHERRRTGISARQQRKRVKASRRGHTDGQPTRAQQKRNAAKEFLPEWQRLHPGTTLDNIMSLGVHKDGA